MEDNLFKPASEKQIAFLRKLGYEGDTEGMTSDECSNLISQLTNKQPQYNTYRPTEEQPQQEVKNQAVSKTVNSIIEKNISDKVLNKLNDLIENQGLVLPDGYNPANALKGAYLTFVKNNLLTAEQNSQAQALLDMCIQGLDPNKNQCYFIKYGNEVNMMRSYFGDKQACKSAHLITDIDANVIYEGDEVNVFYQDNNKMKVEHKTNWKNISNGVIVGAYSFAQLPDGTMVYDIMTMDRIKKSWAMSKNFGDKNKFQNVFSDDACKRTVIRHLAKNIFNAGSDNNVVVESYNRTTANEYDNSREYQDANIEEVNTKQQKAGNKKIDMDVVEDVNI